VQIAVQPMPGGLSQALLIGQEFTAGEPLSSILGDKPFHGRGLPGQLRRVAARTE